MLLWHKYVGKAQVAVTVHVWNERTIVSTNAIRQALEHTYSLHISHLRGQEQPEQQQELPQGTFHLA